MKIYGFLARSSIILWVTVAVSTCGWPLDQRETLKQLSGGTLRVGVLGAPEQLGMERKGLETVATLLNATIEYVPGETHELVDALEMGEIHLLISLPHDTILKEKVGLTRPYYNKTWTHARRTWAVRAGENAWLLRVNDALEISR